ncbi:MAG: acetyl-CoA carboxylase biotin carboxyl carrier protein [Candidatus Neptunochlamydia sp.]|nr:acetyl-CoA carboxylase biotin carboxyl carrier protein [Candidatus Neptunochlamydia sp.]
MDLEKIKELMAAMEDKGMTKVAFKDKNGFELELERGSKFEASPFTTVARQLEPQVQEKLPQKGSEPKEPESKKGHEVTSPMVGTFYTAVSPEADPFVTVGDTVTEETVIGIVEAMKVMNEIKAGKSGVVTAIYVDNAHPVEFGTKLLKLA